MILDTERHPPTLAGCRGAPGELPKAEDHGFAHGMPEILAVPHLDNYPSQGVCRKIVMAGQGIVEKWYDWPSEPSRITAVEHG